MTTTTIPSNKAVLSSLLRADFTTQWRNRRSVILVLLIPVIILFSWKGVVQKVGGPFVLASSITLGLNAIGLMGYANSVARDREKGIFQRLRVAPLTAWSIMASRISVQLAMIVILTLVVFIAGYDIDQIRLSPSGYLVGFLMSLLGGALYLSLGQAIVGLVKNADTVNAVTRLVYFVFIIVGMFADIGVMGHVVVSIVKWSPYGTVKQVLSVGMRPETWTTASSIALLATIGYALLFAALGIKWFKWASK